MEKAEIKKLNSKGQGIGSHSSTEKQLRIWNALPGEKVNYEVIRKKKSYIEAFATDIDNKSENRIDPKESITQMLTTSPLQHMNIQTELELKTEHLGKLFKEAFSDDQYKFTNEIFHESDREYGYRNKMEYSFYGDSEGIHAAFYSRGSNRGKFIVERSALASENSNLFLKYIIGKINLLTEIRASDLKSVIIRSNSKDEIVAALYVKTDIKLDLTEMPEFVKGFAVYYSDPKSPFAHATNLIQNYGVLELTETINNKSFIFGVNSFFQINIPVFEEALKDIKNHAEKGLIIDFYSGVGSIGLCLTDSDSRVVLVEENAEATDFAKRNIEENKIDNSEVFTNQSENLTQFIAPGRTIVFDPPREGLHKNVIARIKEVLPEKLIYLSCNPETQAEDVAQLLESYNVSFHRLYNFFPRTPHCESLVVLEKK